MSQDKALAYTPYDPIRPDKMEPPVSVMPWHHPNPFMALKMQDKAAYKEHILDHLAALDIESPTSPVLLSKIICTIGRASCNFQTIEKMIKNGMAVARIDMSHATLEDNLVLLRETRGFINEYSAKHQRVVPIAIAADIKGPEILTGILFEAEKIQLNEGDAVTLTTHPAWDDKGSKAKIFVDYKDLANILQPRDIILLDYGRVKLSVRGTVDNDIVCDIINGGEVHSYSDVMVLDVPLNIPYVTSKDMKDFEALVSESIDIVFISATVSKYCVDVVRQVLSKDNLKGNCLMIISKIESKLGLSKFDEILSASDGIIINRGKMGIELSTEKVMQAQKSMVAKATKVGKPIYSVTEFLNSMIHKNCPTFAEAADVIATIQDGVDGIILKDETAIGEFPEKTVRILNTLSREAESLIWQQEIWSSLNQALALYDFVLSTPEQPTGSLFVLTTRWLSQGQQILIFFHLSSLANESIALTCNGSFSKFQLKATPPVDPAHAIAIASVEASLKAHAAAIIVVTTSGTSAKLIARYRPRCPVMAVTRYGAVARQMNLFKCILPVHYISAPHKNWHMDVDLRMQFAINYGKIEKFIRPGDPMVLVSGWRQGAGFTNNIRVVYASADEAWVLPFSQADIR